MATDILSNEEIIRRVESWQNAGFLHPLTCYSSKHPLLEPVINNGHVILRCPKCRYEQKVPSSILQVIPEELEAEKQRLIGIGFKIDTKVKTGVYSREECTFHYCDSKDKECERNNKCHYSD